MEYVQGSIATVHRLTDAVPDAPVNEAAVVVPMTDREYRKPAPEHVLSTLEDVRPARVIVALRAPAERVQSFRAWLSSFDVPIDLLWCNAPDVERLLEAHGLENGFGKGRDVWLALGVAADTADLIVCHDADATSYAASIVPRLLAPIDAGFDFSKGYYARVEDGRLYGRLCRLFYEPLLRALRTSHDAPVLEYLDAFHYALAGEFATTAELALTVRAQRSWGLEVGMLGEVFGAVGFDGTAQVDLGRHQHDHRAVGGATGLSDMSRHVGAALFRTVAEHGVNPDFATLPDRYRTAGTALIEQYATDAAINGLAYDAPAERAQLDEYVNAIRRPGEDRRLPPWRDAPFTPRAVAEASSSAVDRCCAGATRGRP